jgi:hypothetical protein
MLAIFFIIFPLECGMCVMPEGATTPKQIVNLNSSDFRGILNGKYDVIIIHFYAKR